MILPADILTENNISVKTHLKYSKDFTFIPIKYKKKCDLCIQTPKIYIPFGINNRFNKQFIEVSFFNMTNDSDTEKCYNQLQIIYKKIKDKFPSFNVNPFIKDDKFRLKTDNMIIFDNFKKKIETIKSNIYGNFIIYLQGLWKIKNEIWFHWVALQCKIDIPLYLNNYSFIENDDMNTYKRLLQNGLSIHNVEERMKLDKKDIKLLSKPKPIPPPPPLPPSFKKATDLSLIIQNNKKNIKKTSHKDINTPSLHDIQFALKNLNKI